MAVKTFVSGEVLTAADTNTYLNNGGLVYVTQQTIGTAVASVTVSGCFSSTYDNYRIVVRGYTTSAVGGVNNFIRCSMGASTTLHYGSTFYDEWTGASTGYHRTGNGTGWVVCISSQSSGDCGTAFDLQNPFLTSNTTIFGNYYGYGWSGWIGGSHATATSYDSFKLTPSTGTITGGTITVYGYRKA